MKLSRLFIAAAAFIIILLAACAPTPGETETPATPTRRPAVSPEAADAVDNITLANTRWRAVRSEDGVRIGVTWKVFDNLLDDELAEFYGNITGERENGWCVYVSASVSAILAPRADSVGVIVFRELSGTWNEYKIPLDERSGKISSAYIGFTGAGEGWTVLIAETETGDSITLATTRDGGATWQCIGAGVGMEKGITGAGFVNRFRGFISTATGVLFTAEFTSDEGWRFYRLWPELPEKYASATITGWTPRFDGNRGIYPLRAVYTENGVQRVENIYLRTEDGGLTWSFDAEYAGRIDNRVAALGYSWLCEESAGVKLKLSWSGSVCAEMELPGAAAEYYKYMYLSGSQKNGFFVYASGKISAALLPGEDGLYAAVSRDGMKSWTEYKISGDTGVKTAYIGFSTDKRGWAAAETADGTKVYITQDGGESWTLSREESGKTGLTGAGAYDGEVILAFKKDKNIEALLPAAFADCVIYGGSPVFNVQGAGVWSVYVGGRLAESYDRNGAGTAFYGTVYLISRDGGQTWKLNSSQDSLKYGELPPEAEAEILRLIEQFKRQIGWQKSFAAGGEDAETVAEALWAHISKPYLRADAPEDFRWQRAELLDYAAARSGDTWTVTLKAEALLSEGVYFEYGEDYERLSAFDGTEYRKYTFNITYTVKSLGAGLYLITE